MPDCEAAESARSRGSCPFGTQALHRLRTASFYRRTPTDLYGRSPSLAPWGSLVPGSLQRQASRTCISLVLPAFAYVSPWPGLPRSRQHLMP